MSSTHSALSPSEEKKEAYLPQGEGEGETAISPQTLEEGDAPLGKVTGEPVSMRVATPTDRDRADEKSPAKASDYFTLMASGFALVSDGYQNNLSTVFNAIFKILYPADYTSAVSTRVSNSLLVGGRLPRIGYLAV
jgi:hypothetical protein